ncbi:hypothetical protein IAT38_000894 [Cryptococcus sp. DSM 104549]
MESYSLPNFPASHSTLHIALFQNVANSPEIRKRLIQASITDGEEGARLKAEVDFGFVEATLLVSKDHLLTAILSTLLYAYPSTSPAPAIPATSPGTQPPPLSSLSLSPPAPKTRSHNLHSELLLLLSPNNNITDSIRRHGISDSTTRLAVVRFGGAGETVEQVWEGMSKVVDGELVGWDSLEEETDWARVDKVYKLNELNALKTPDVVEKKKTAVISSVAVKNVL